MGTLEILVVKVNTYLNSCKNVDNDLFQSNIDLDILHGFFNVLKPYIE
jgi:hypothetical protein